MMVERIRSPSAAPYVLVVEDNEDARELVRLLIESEGYEVGCAENGKEALELIHRRRPSFMLVDLMMPVMSGWELLDIMKRDPALASIPVGILSAAHDVGDEIRESGLFRAKPVRPETLLELVAELAALARVVLAVAV